MSDFQSWIFWKPGKTPTLGCKTFSKGTQWQSLSKLKSLKSVLLLTLCSRMSTNINKQNLGILRNSKKPNLRVYVYRKFPKLSLSNEKNHSWTALPMPLWASPMPGFCFYGYLSQSWFPVRSQGLRWRLCCQTDFQLLGPFQNLQPQRKTALILYAIYLHRLYFSEFLNIYEHLKNVTIRTIWMAHFKSVFFYFEAKTNFNYFLK